MTPVRPLAPGDVVHGAHGVFGRDHDHCVRIEAVGPDWIVARDPDREHDEPVFAAGRRALELCQEARDEDCPRDNPCPLTTQGGTR
ncbi:hypothetical protein [Streptomyces chumphonensis]|uniref:hypothetical protein n=1 Tax=Streptomyces chumphonensis TaxID=1214925 RepID=UPI003D75673E